PNSWDAVIRWGNSDGADDGRHLVLNPVEALERIKDPAYVVDTFKAHGISTRYYKPAHSRIPRVRARYRIHVFDLRTVAFFRKSRGKYRRVTALTTKQLQRARDRKSDEEHTSELQSR